MRRSVHGDEAPCIDWETPYQPPSSAVGLLSRPRDARAPRLPSLRLLLKLSGLRRALRATTLVLLDLLAVLLAIGTALELRLVLKGSADLSFPVAQLEQAAPLACLVTVLLFARSGLYDRRSVRPGFRAIASALFQVMLVALIYALVEGARFSSYFIFYGSYFFALAYVSVARHAFEKASGRFLAAAGYRRRALVLGSPQGVESVLRTLAHDEREAVEPVRSVRLEGPGRVDVIQHVDACRDSIDEVLIADPDFPEGQCLELAERCRRHGLRLLLVPSTLEIVRDRAEFVPGRALPLFELKPAALEGLDFAAKRAFDLVTASLLVVCLAPMLALIGIAVKLSSPGPLLYRSMRRGMGEVPFPCFKFRTMVVDAEARQDELEEGAVDRAVLFKVRDDPRITGVGRFLRRSSLDELPQLLNVLRGEMSLVGPRPLPYRDYALMDGVHRRRYAVLPGISGLWQVTGRSDLSFEEMARLDIFYIENWSVWLDITVLLKTIPAVVTMRGAY